MQPGVYPKIDEEAYHSGPGISKSGLWTIHTRTPFHFRYGEKKETNSQKFGKGAHAAVLEPEAFEVRFVRGPEDRRGNKWKDAVAEAARSGAALLTESEFDDALRLRDALHRDPLVQKIARGALIEQSAYWIDEATGELVRIRPDAYNGALSLMGDLKSTTDASKAEWCRRISDYGYHVQHAAYALGWSLAGGGPVGGFVFITVESKAPFAHAIYELENRAVARGYEIFRSALDTYHRCRVADVWPGYGSGVQPIDLPEWNYRDDAAPAAA